MSDAPRGSTGWRSGEPPAVRRQVGLSRGARRFFALTALLAVAGAIVGALYYITPAEPPQVFTFFVSEYTESAWPPNPWAEEDAAALLTALPRRESSPENAFNYQQLDHLQGKVEALAATKSRQPVIVYISALATTDPATGSVYILPGDAESDKPATWMALDKLLNALSRCEAKHKILLLDLAHPTAADPLGGYPGRGPLADAVATALDTQLSKRAAEDALPFLVLTSCSSDELSLPMDEQQKSAFMFYVAQGLRGAADGYGREGADGRVSVRELAAYVRDRVARWARDCRGISQNPKLHGGELPDFVLTLTSRNAESTDPEQPAPRPYPGWLFDGWKLRDDWFLSGMYQAAPHRFAELQTALQRGERDWQAVGKPERVAKVADGLKTARDNATRAGERPRQDLPASRSLAAWTANPPSALANLIEGYLEAYFKDPEKDAPPKRGQFVEATKATPEARRAGAVAIWRRLQNDDFRQQKTVVALSKLWDAARPPSATTSEELLVRRLANWQPQNGLVWPGPAARQLLNTEEAANRALAAAPADFPWAQQMFEAAAQLRIQGEKALLSERDPAARNLAGEKLKQAETMFDDARLRIESVQVARRAFEEAAVVLPAVAGRVADLDLAAERVAWGQACRVAGELADRLERKPSPGDWKQTAELMDAISTLRKPYSPASVKRQVDDLAGGTALAYRELQTSLRGPMLPAVERKLVWEKVQAIGERLDKKTREADTADDAIRQTRGSGKTVDPPLKDEADRRKRRAEKSIDLLRLAGLKTANDLEKALCTKGEPDWGTFAKDLRHAWTVDLPKEARKYATSEDWDAADRRERIVPPEFAPSGPSAAARLRSRDRLKYLEWLAKYYHDLGELRVAVPGAEEFYESAARESR